ncbi:MAG: hypothetical protein N7Q72_06285 [Spiroplasma sp. Tabriz.8]|nr:hypothetical protein [Spiroplasma sp. Tabriz.8]
MKLPKELMAPDSLPLLQVLSLSLSLSLSLVVVVICLSKVQ